MHFVHINANSILSKIEEVRIIASKTKAAVIGISESKLDENVLNGEINIPGYNILRSDRNRHGGGVLCYIKIQYAIIEGKVFRLKLKTSLLTYSYQKLNQS